MELVVAFLCVLVLGQSAAIAGLVWAILRKQGMVAPILPPERKSEPQSPKQPAFYHGVAGTTSVTVNNP